ncbi:MAG TPA: hypothetical protein VM734_20740 [Kofleriaceae bacterium]|jgi:hypothetical protein|nr:hypothetical protein [Kofleriaceae bacterium]
MDHRARAKFMGKVVMPSMRALFEEFDAEAFGTMDCKTCHGPGADDHSFEMPNPQLDALSGDMIMNPDADHKAITEFMMTKVRPTMAQLIGAPEWSPETPEGLGCFACHPMKP